MFRGRRNHSDATVQKNASASSDTSDADNARIRLARPYIFAMTVIVSIGGFIFGKWKQDDIVATPYASAQAPKM
jgi:hypothetical protein